MITASVRVAERGLDLELRHREGRTLAIIGSNGAGKSTMISLLAGLLVPDPASSIEIGGREVVDPWVGPHERPIALLSQDPTLFPHLTALDNVAFGLRARGMEKGKAHAIARDRLAEVGIAELEDRKPSELSGGQAQRVALARALAIEPEVLLLDEPLAAMDVKASEHLRELLKEALEGRTGIIVTHDREDVEALADDFILIDGGVIVSSGEAKDALADPHSPLSAHFA